MDLVALESPHGTAVLSPATGASLRSLKARSGSREVELLSGGDGVLDVTRLPLGTGSFIMAPWPNRIRDGRLVTADGEYRLPIDDHVHAIHGTVRGRAWDVVGQSDTRAVLETDLLPPWPFRGRVIYEVELVGQGLLQTLTIEAAASERPFPSGFGWHPWFRRRLGTHDAKVYVGAEVQWVLDDTVTPTSEVVESTAVHRLREGTTLAANELDACFRLHPGGEARLEWPELILTLSCTPELGHVMVYSPEHAVCVEPQTCTVNAFQLAAAGVPQTGTAIVEPGKPLRGSTAWTWRFLE